MLFLVTKVLCHLLKNATLVVIEHCDTLFQAELLSNVGMQIVHIFHVISSFTPYLQPALVVVVTPCVNLLLMLSCLADFGYGVIGCQYLLQILVVIGTQQAVECLLSGF